ncbi:MAG: hypothetical protein KGL75_03200 [Acidobacteriota bacterium]|nr:hypothetical protein [Acidobacteriota bacterium]
MRYFFIVVVLMALSFGGGFWWEHGRAASVQQKLNAASEQLAQANSTLAQCRLQDHLLTLVEDTANKNYGEAAALSTKFFNDVNDEIPRVNQPNVKFALQSILAQRDQATGELAKGDPAAHDLFVQMSMSFHQATESAQSTP